jgi:mannitol-specific phosphotransferase system IIBC component
LARARTARLDLVVVPSGFASAFAFVNARRLSRRRPTALLTLLVDIDPGTTVAVAVVIVVVIVVVVVVARIIIARLFTVHDCSTRAVRSRLDGWITSREFDGDSDDDTQTPTERARVYVYV